MLEEWRPVVGYEGYYEVSHLGRVRRVKGGMGARPGRVLVPSPHRDGYLYVGLCREGKQRWPSVHRLVAEAFIGPCPPGCEVNHKHGVKTDNRPGELEWVTPPANKRHAYALGLNRGRHGPGPSVNRGAGNGRAKLNEAAVLAIRAARGVRTHVDLAREYGVAPSRISEIQRGKTWAHVAAR